MELDKRLIEKLKYLEQSQIKTKDMNKIQLEEKEKLNFTKIKNKEIKLINNFNKNFYLSLKNKKSFQNENEILNYKNYQINLNKLNTIHIYSNFVAVIFMLKYLDMIMIVKKGGKHF